jgi:hypothetical protein
MDLQLGSWHETIASGVPFNRMVYRNGLHPRVFVKTVSRLLRQRDPVTVWEQAQKRRFEPLLGRVPQHAVANRIRDFDRNAWNQHFKFAFVRNPFARMVSQYNWDKKSRRNPNSEWITFSRYVRLSYEKDKNLEPHRDISRFYCIGGKPCLDFVGRFEQLKDDMKTVIDQLRLPVDLARFPHAKPGKSDAYRSYYSPEETKLVTKMSEWEIDTFKYVF